MKTLKKVRVEEEMGDVCFLQRIRSCEGGQEVELLLSLGNPPYHNEPRWRSSRGLTLSEPLRFSKERAIAEASFFNSRADGWEYRPLEWSKL